MTNETFLLRLPIKTISELNRRGAWQGHERRRKKQREAVSLMMRSQFSQLGIVRCWPGWRVTLTRVAPLELDPGDNLPSSMKAIRDQVAVELRLRSDRDPRVEFLYRQTVATDGQYWVEMQIEKVMSHVMRMEFTNGS